MSASQQFISSPHVLFARLTAGDQRALARVISYVENDTAAAMEILQLLPDNPDVKITGITGPPGAGKSTLADLLIEKLIARNRKVGILCIDPASPFHHGALLGDRIRMHKWYNHPSVFIRSLSTRGASGGLHPKIIEISDLLKAAGYTDILIETVGVGQNEIEIAALADTTVVVLVPEAGDEIQLMKSGLMEVADIFAVNKSDRPDALKLAGLLEQALDGQKQLPVPVIKTIATTGEGIEELMRAVGTHQQHTQQPENRSRLLAGRAWQLIRDKKMQHTDKELLAKKILEGLQEGNFNLYRFVEAFA